MKETTRRRVDDELFSVSRYVRVLDEKEMFSKCRRIHYKKIMRRIGI